MLSRKERRRRPKRIRKNQRSAARRADIWFMHVKLGNAVVHMPQFMALIKKPRNPFGAVIGSKRNNDMESKYQQPQRGKERDDIVKAWYEGLPLDERNAIDRVMRKLSMGLKHIDVTGMLELIIAMDCAGATSWMIGGKNG